MVDLSKVDAQTRQILETYGFDAVPFDELTARLLDGGLDPARNRLESPVALPPSGTMTSLSDLEEAERLRLRAIGAEAIENGEVGVVILNGGMATRFGGVPKGAATAFAGRSFLDFKLAQVARAGGGRAPVLLMNSFATEGATKVHLDTLSPGCEVRCFNQMVSMRLTPEGELFLDAAGVPSLHAPGHGDFPTAIARCGELSRFREAGGRYLTLSNVDNLGAGLDPLIIGAHIAGNRAMSVELVRTDPGDVGGFPALVDGKVRIVEAFRIPLSFDAASIPVFNTNTFVFDAEVLEGRYELDWFAVQKTVDGRTAIQFERLVGQLTDFVDVSWLVVSRAGKDSRFLPIKVPADLDRLAPELEAVLSAQGVL